MTKTSPYQKEFAERVIARAKKLLAEEKDYTTHGGWFRAGQLEETVRRLLEVIEGGAS